LARYGLAQLGDETLFPAFSSLSALLLGCFVMGVLLQQKEALMRR